MVTRVKTTVQTKERGNAPLQHLARQLMVGTDCRCFLRIPAIFFTWSDHAILKAWLTRIGEFLKNPASPALPVDPISNAMKL